MSIIRSLLVKVGVDMTNAQKGFKQLSKDLKSTGKSMKQTGATLTKGLTLPILGAVAGLTAMTVSAGKSADELLTLSAKTGLTTDQLQELQYAARFVDVEVETVTGSMQKLTKNMDMARRGSKEQEEAFAKLNVQYKNNDGTLRSAKDVWYDAIDALGEMANEADRDAVAMSLFGKSAAELNPIIKAGSKELESLSKEAHTVGAVLSVDNVKALGKFDDSMQKFQAVLKKAGAEIGVAFLPVLESMKPVIEKVIIPAIKNIAKLLADLIKWFSGLSKPMKDFVILLGVVAVAIGPVMTMGGHLVTTLGNIAARMATAAASGGGFINTLTAILGKGGLVALGIAALGIAIGGLVIALNNAEGAAGTLRKEFEESNKVYQENNAKIEANARIAGELTKELYDLQDKENKSNAEKARMQLLVERLNQLYPELNLEIDKQTGLLNKNREAVIELLKERVKEIKLQQDAERMNELYNEQEKIVNEITEAQKRVQTEQDKVNKLIEQGWTKDQLLEYSYALDVAQAELDTLN